MIRSKFLVIGYDVESGDIDINSKDFNILYGNSGDFHGTQCNYLGGTEESDKIQKILDNIADEVRELYEINIGKEK